MLRRVLILFCFLAIGAAFLFSPEAEAWGFYGHKRINRMAVFTLPDGIFPFYKKHIEFLTEHAVDPDKRRYAVDGEAPRHYIDIDHYTHDGSDPFDVMPVKWQDAVDKYTEDTLMAYGIVPWHIDKMMFRLTNAFINGDVDRILRYSADLGHYVGDAHVPLHTTENYNGQLTGQRGIHGFWESRIPELSAEDYDHFVGKAEYLNDPLEAAWDAVRGSHYALDSVLSFERTLSASWPEDTKYAYEDRGRVNVRTYSQEYADAYEEMLGGQVERRMNRSIITLGSMWYTAWTNAGQPDLLRFEEKEVSDSLKVVLEEQENFWKEGRIKGREHDN